MIATDDTFRSTLADLMAGARYAPRWTGARGWTLYDRLDLQDTGIRYGSRTSAKRGAALLNNPPDGRYGYAHRADGRGYDVVRRDDGMPVETVERRQDAAAVRDILNGHA